MIYFLLLLILQRTLLYFRHDGQNEKDHDSKLIHNYNKDLLKTNVEYTFDIELLYH